MKVFVVLACLVVCASSSYLAPAPVVVTSKLLSTGSSQSSRTQDAAGNYAFQYSESNPTGGSSRQESGNGWGSSGSYELHVADGRKRIVKYTADGSGFRAAISTNEPGTAAQPAADTSIASPYAAPEPVKALPVLAPVAEPVLVQSGWGAAPLPLAKPEPLVQGWGAPLARPEPALVQGWGAPLAVAAVPAVSSYSTSINHVSAVAAPEPLPLTQGWIG